MATKTILSLQEFLQLPREQPDGAHYELDEGELIRLSAAGRTHAALVIRIASYLDGLLDPARFTVLGGEAGVILSDVEDRGIVRGADVAVENTSELDEGYAREPFVVAVEVVSRDHDPEDLERKKNQYLQAGTETWLVYPRAGTIHVCNGSQLGVHRRGDRFHSIALDHEIDTGKFFVR
jgi:Uma2 family endonuclease